MKSAPSLPVIWIPIALLGFSASIVAQEPASPSLGSTEPLRRAQQRLIEGDFEGALGLFESVESAAFSDADRYNHGIALYRSQRLEAAAEAFQSAASASDPSLAARARFNLGNTAYAQALEYLEKSPETVPEAIASLHQAIDHYRSALRVAPQDRDARVNIELARRLIEELNNNNNNNNNNRRSSSRGRSSRSSSKASNRSKAKRDRTRNNRYPRLPKKAKTAKPKIKNSRNRTPIRSHRKANEISSKISSKRVRRSKSQGTRRIRAVKIKAMRTRTSSYPTSLSPNNHQIAKHQRIRRRRAINKTR